MDCHGFAGRYASAHRTDPPGVASRYAQARARLRIPYPQRTVTTPGNRPPPVRRHACASDDIRVAFQCVQAGPVRAFDGSAGSDSQPLLGRIEKVEREQSKRLLRLTRRTVSVNRKRMPKRRY